MSPLLPITLSYIVGILLAELPAMIAYVVLCILSGVAATWFLLRRRGRVWCLIAPAIWMGYLMMLLTAPALPMHSREAARAVRQLQRAEAASTAARTAALRAACRTRLVSAGLDAPTVSLAHGILLGDKSAVAPDLRDGMREAGMSHILAVSGLHVGILFAILLTLLYPLRCLGMEWLRQLLVLTAMWVYVAGIGMPPSAVRAALTVSVITLSLLNHSNPWGWHNLTTAAFLLLLWKPWWLWDLGFQLSFLATAGILAFQPLITVRPQRLSPAQAERERQSPQRWLRRTGRLAARLGQQLRSLFWLSTAAQLATLPLVAHVFGHVPLLGVLQGFVVVPLLPLYVGGLLLVLCLPSAGLFLAPLLNGFTGWIAGIADFTAVSEYAMLGGRLEWSPSRLEMWIAYSGIVAAVLWWRLHDKKTL